MQFRQRRRVIQVIRTVYDPARKRGRAEVIGRLDKDGPAIDEALRAACTSEELAEVEAFLAEHAHRRSRREAEAAAAELPDRMRQAEAWFRAHHTDGKAAGQLAAEIWTAWQDLEKALVKRGIGPSKRVAASEKSRGGTMPQELGEARQGKG